MNDIMDAQHHLRNYRKLYEDIMKAVHFERSSELVLCSIEQIHDKLHKYIGYAKFPQVKTIDEIERQHFEAWSRKLDDLVGVPPDFRDGYVAALRWVMGTQVEIPAVYLDQQPFIKPKKEKKDE
jgi:hypothetical protein